MVMQPYKGFIEEFKDLKIKFTNDKTETKILSFVENNGWNEKNIDQFTSETNILINKGAFPTDTHTPLSLILTPNTNPKQQHISFQAFV
jgi:glycine/serine hydroxymethyltransferase